MVARTRACAALALLPVLLAGCTGCTFTRAPVGKPVLTPSPLVSTQLTRADIGGIGWSTRSDAQWCPTHVTVLHGEDRLAPTKTVATELRGGDCVVVAGSTIAFHAPQAAKAGEVELTFRLDASLPGETTAQADVTTTVPIVPAPAGSAPPAGTPDEPGPLIADLRVSNPTPAAERAVLLDLTGSTGNGTRIQSYRFDRDGDGMYEYANGYGQVTVSFPRPGTYTVGGSVIDNRNRSSSTTRTITVHEQAGPDAAFTMTPQSPVAGAAATFDASGTTDIDGDRVVSYAWDFGDGQRQTTDQPRIEHTYATAGDRTVTLETTDDRGLTGTPASMIVHVAAGRATASAARGRRPSALVAPFKLGLQGALLSQGKVSRVGGRLRARGLLAGGKALAAIPAKLARRAPKGLRPFRGARWVGRFDATFAGTVPRPDRVRGSGYALVVSATKPKTSVCLRVSGDARRDRGNRFTVVGGTGDARRLVARGGFGEHDTVVARTARKLRPLPRQCARLRKALARVR